MIIRSLLTRLSSIQMELVLRVAVRIRRLKFGISEVRDLFSITMHIVTTLMKSISIQMVDIYSPVAMILPLRYGTWGKVIYFSPSRVTRGHQPLLPSHHAVTISQQVALIQLWWFGRLTLRKMSKSSSKILVPNQSKNCLKQVEFQCQEGLQNQLNLILQWWVLHIWLEDLIIVIFKHAEINRHQNRDLTYQRSSLRRTHTEAAVRS